MSIVATRPNPCLLAILFVAQSRAGSGAQIVFHYPADPLSDAQLYQDQTANEFDEDESSSSDDSDDEESSSSTDVDFQIFTKRAQNEGNGSPDAPSRLSDEDDEFPDTATSRDDGKWRPSWEPLLGLGEDGLVSLLAPGRAWHKRKFELTINDLTFLGRPVYAREDGLWQKAGRNQARVHEEESPGRGSGTAHGSENHEDDDDDDDDMAAADARSTQSLRPIEPAKSQLTMFHAVFVMDPPPLEHAIRVKDMYDNVVKKFSKALKWEQARNDYIWRQADLMQSIKSAHVSQRTPTAALYAETLKRSSLAAAVAKVFDAISTSRIAAITLSPRVSVSLQIPPVTSASYLPSLTEPPLQPGLWLTTATGETTSDSDPATPLDAMDLAKNFTLLLKASPAKILKDVQAAGSPLALLLANFLDKAKPTKSFAKISVASQISRADIQHLARHLIYWRRAIAIPPLHQRDTYIVSPNADMTKLVAACKAYESAFPMMPALPRILHALSGTPAPYGTLIPSSDHKEEYYKVLAWLMRGGWVAQLRTFAYVRVDPEVKKAVREREREEKQPQRKPIPYQSDPKDDSHSAGLNRGNGTPVSSSSYNSTTNVPPFKRPSVVSHPSSEGRQSSISDTPSHSITPHNPKTASLILSPPRASPEESKWLDYIADSLLTSPQFSHLPADERAELRTYWPMFVKSFNGSDSLEKIPIREGLKRKFVWDMLTSLGLDFDRGVEDDRGENKAILVSFRHW